MFVTFLLVTFLAVLMTFVALLAFLEMTFMVILEVMTLILFTSFVKMPLCEKQIFSFR